MSVSRSISGGLHNTNHHSRSPVINSIQNNNLSSSLNVTLQNNLRNTIQHASGQGLGSSLIETQAHKKSIDINEIKDPKS